MSWTTWYPSPLILDGGAIALMLFATGFAKLRRRGRRDLANWPRAALFLLAVALGTLPLVSPLDEAGDTYLLSAHMLQHVLIGEVAPALALIALRGPLLFFVVPGTVLRRLARLAPLRSALAFLLRPRVSIATWALVIGVWHVPAAYDYTLTHQTVHDLAHLSFIAAGLLAWSQIVDPARRKALDIPQRLTCAVAMAAFAVAVGSVLLFAAPLYPAYAHQGTRLFGLSPIADQQLAGLVMIGEQLCALALCAAFLLPARARARRAAPPVTVVAPILRPGEAA